MARAVTIAALWLLAAIGCDGDDAVVPDGGVDATADATDVTLPWPGDGPPVALPALVPCPDGWREVTTDVSTCEPYPESGFEECPLGEGHFPGEPGCRRLGTPCPAGDFAEGLPTDGSVVYVLAGATGGDGSAAAPFGELDDVEWGALDPGSSVALSKGTHRGIVSLRPGVALVGACVAQTQLAGGLETNIAAISAFLPGEASTVRDLSIVNAPHPGLRADGGAELRVTGVAIVEASVTGGFARDPGSLLVLEDVVIAQTTPDLGGAQGRGIGVQTGGRVEGRRLVLDRNADGAIFIGGPGAMVDIEDAYVRGTVRPDEAGDRGVQAQDGAALVARRTLFEQNREVGIFAGRDGTSITLEDVIIRGTLPRLSDGVFGRGINAQDGAELTLTRVVLERNHDVGLVVAEAGTTGTLEDVVVRDTLPNAASSNFGRGVSVQNGANARVSRVLLARNHDVALAVTDAEATLVLEDATIRETLPQESDDANGYGLHAQLTGVVTASRVVVSGSFGLGIASLFSTMDLTDVLVDDTRIARCGPTTCPSESFGYGIATISGTTRVDTFAIRDAATCGVIVAGDVGELDLVHGVVTGSEIGACIQVRGYDPDRLSDDVRYQDNRANLQSTSLPVPDAIDPSR